MLKFIKVVVILLTIFAILVGCQPTPEKPPVVEKDDLNQKIMQTAAATSFDTPKRWQEILNDGDMQVTIDVGVEMPDVSSWPVLKVTPHGFTVQDAQKAVDVFMKGQPIYEYSNVRTKVDIEQDILWLEAKIEQTGNDINLTEVEREKRIESYSGDLKYYREEYNNAPEQAPERKPAMIEFKADSDTVTDINRFIDVEADLGNPRPALLSIAVSEDNMTSGISFSNKDNPQAYYHPYFEATDTLSGLNVSRQNALKTAEDTLRKLGLVDARLSYARAGIDVEGLPGSEFEDAVSDPERNKCYIFYFSRVVDGIPVTNLEYCNGIKGDDNGEVYDKIWLSENIEIAVNDSGVLWFNWFNPADTGEALNANVQLKSFEEIKSIFRKQMFYERTWTLSGINDSAITIKRATLGLMRVRMEERGYVYLPVWDFIGDWTRTGDTLKDVSFLTLNAIDGSVIDREVGY